MQPYALPIFLSATRSLDCISTILLPNLILARHSYLRRPTHLNAGKLHLHKSWLVCKQLSSALIYTHILPSAQRAVQHYLMPRLASLCNRPRRSNSTSLPCPSIIPFHHKFPIRQLSHHTKPINHSPTARKTHPNSSSPTTPRQTSAQSLAPQQKNTNSTNSTSPTPLSPKTNGSPSRPQPPHLPTRSPPPQPQTILQPRHPPASRSPPPQ